MNTPIFSVYCVGCGKSLNAEIQANKVRLNIPNEIWIYPCKSCSKKESIDKVRYPENEDKP